MQSTLRSGLAFDTYMIKARKQYLQLGIMVVIYLTMTACASVHIPQLSQSEPVQIQPDNPIPYEIVNARQHQQHLYIRYLEGGELLHASAPLQRPTIDQQLKPVPDFSLLKKRAWKKHTQSALPVAILTQYEWNKFRQRLIGPLLPSKPQSAFTIEDTRKTFYVYTDAQSTASVGDRLPENTKIDLNYNSDDIQNKIFVELKNFLQEQHAPATRVLFNTGYKKQLSTYYLYIDLQQQQLAILGLNPTTHNIDAELIRRSLLTDSGLTVGQTIKSFYTDFIFRPVSSIQRLFFLLTDTSLDTLRRTSISAVGFPSLQSKPIPPLSYHPGMDLEAWETELDKITGKKSSKGTMDFLIDGKEFFPRFIDAADNAKESLLMQTYIFDTDDYAIKIADLLRKKSTDINVKVIYDGSGSLIASWGDSPSQPQNYAPPAYIRHYLRHKSKVKSRALATPWLAGDHTKVTLIDRDTAFVGGMNIGREYRYEWHDLMMEVKGPVVNKLRREFDKAWAHYGWWGDLGYLGALLKPSKKNKTDFGYPIRVLRTLPRRSDIYHTQIAAIRNAKRYIYIHNSYFSEDTMLYELAKARRRGVDVRVILSVTSDADILNRSNVLAVNAMLKNGVRVFVYPGVSHIKAAIYDGWACLGSANFDHLSMRVNKELNLATSHRETVNELKQRLFDKDFAASVEITEPLPNRWTDHVLEVVADQL